MEAVVSSDLCSNTTEEARTLSESQRERIRRNKEKAKSIRQARIASIPYDVTASRDAVERFNKTLGTCPNGVCSVSSASRDSGGGFLLEDEDDIRRERNCQLVEEDAPALPDEQMVCSECGKRFAESFLFSKFRFTVCDQCRDPKEKHSLITKTEAKQKYLLKDCDFGERDGPPLPFILKRNPHSSYQRDMYLYLKAQVETRAYKVWGGEKGLEEERERKREAREKKREKKYTKEIQNLRKAVRRSSMPLSSSRSHEHVFSEEIYCPETDTWSKTCSECGHKISYEKITAVTPSNGTERVVSRMCPGRAMILS